MAARPCGWRWRWEWWWNLCSQGKSPGSSCSEQHQGCKTRTLNKFTHILYLQQLSNASSPAESVVSTSSNPGHSLGSSGASSRSVQPQVSPVWLGQHLGMLKNEKPFTGQEKEKNEDVGKKVDLEARMEAAEAAHPLWWSEPACNSIKISPPLYLYLFISCFHKLLFVHSTTLMLMWCQGAHWCIVLTCELHNYDIAFNIPHFRLPWI